MARKRKKNQFVAHTKGKGANYRPTSKGCRYDEDAGVKAYRKANPGSKLKTAVTGKGKERK